jgi:Holliday junction DNA helicase RuvA
VELRDKLGKQSFDQVLVRTTAIVPIDSDAVHALVALGIGRPMAEQAVKKTISSLTPDAKSGGNH